MKKDEAQIGLPGFLAERLARDGGKAGRVPVAAPAAVSACRSCGAELGDNRVGTLCLRCAWGGDGKVWGWTKGWQPPADALGSYHFKTKPYGHQAMALLRMANETSFAALMEMGTGKTKVLLDDWAARVYAGELRDLLIIAPAGVYLNWNLEISEHLDDELRERTVIAPWVSGGGVARRRHLEWALGLRDPRRPRIILVNVEALSSVQEAEQACHDLLAGRQAEIVVDESTTIRTPDSSRTMALLRMRQSARVRRTATGLPSPKSPLDLYSQFEFLNPSILQHSSYYSFKARFAIQKSIRVRREVGGVEVVRNQNIVVGFRNIEELRERILPSSFRVLKDECLDLPPKVYEWHDVAMTAEQLRVYTEVKRVATSQLEGGAYVTADSVITQLTRLTQIACGYVVDEEGVYHDLPTNRPAQLLEILGRHDGKAIIWAPYIPALERLQELIRREFGQRSLVRFWGDVPPAEREEAKVRFQNDPDCRWFLGNPAAGGRGITLTAASLVVYYANSWDLEHRLQSEDRPHRSGLKHSVTYIDMRVRGTVEERQVAALRAKRELAAAVTGDGPRQWLV